MIYRVGDQDHPSYDYSRQKPTQVSGDSEKFSLDHQKKEDFSPNKEEKGEDKKLHEKTKESSLREKSGVKLELSGSGAKLASKEDKLTTASPVDTASGSALWDSVKDTLRKLTQYVKDILYRIWNDPSEEASSIDVTPEEAERYTEEYYALKRKTAPKEDNTTAEQASAADRNVVETDKLTDLVELSNPVNERNRDTEIQKYLRSGNLEQVLSLLTDNGKRTIAKNSTLLTYYDKSGRLTSINPSDRERILHGDRHSKSL